MVNDKSVVLHCEQIGGCAERISSLTSSLPVLAVEKNNASLILYEEMRISELENLQKLTLELTRMISEEHGVNVDEADAGSFFAGELNSNIGEKKVEEVI